VNKNSWQTLEAFDAIGEKGDWKRRYEKGHEQIAQAKKELIEKDPNKTVKVHNVYRIRVEDGISEFIAWDQETTGKTGIGNPVTYYQGPEDLCWYLEPTQIKEIRFNAEKQEQEVVTKPDIDQVVKHYLFPFNKENIAMIQKITKSNRRCKFYVRDVQGVTRAVKDYETWSTKPFDYLIEFHPTESIERMLQHQQYH
jgi:hypothetical protein